MTRAFPAGAARATRALFTRILTALATDLRDAELSVGQAAALHLVDQAGSLALSTLASELGLSPSATTRLVDDLVRRELLDRGEDPSDRRSKILSMTPAGTEFMARASAKRDRILLETIETNAPRFVVNAMLKAMDRVGAKIAARPR